MDRQGAQDRPDRYPAAWKSYERSAVTCTDVPGGRVVHVHENCFAVRFDDHGRCREFTEYFIEHP